MQITPGQAIGGGPAGTQQLTITIGTGSSDRLAVTGATFNGHLFRLTVSGFDVNISALYSVSVTSTGKVIIPAQPNNGTWDGNPPAAHVLSAGAPSAGSYSSLAYSW